jgi:predicted AAA+ superfamily ATPase
MEIQRNIQQQLIVWKNASERKPLILRGARQVGKTWLLKHFGENEFEDVAYFNFDEQLSLKQFFEQTKDVKRILQNLSMVHGKPIFPQKTLILFDEIQECNEALNVLKYFCENAPEYAIACAGSLLGVSLSKGMSFPVGKVDFMDIYPLSFAEFLAASDAQLFAYLENRDTLEPIPDIFFQPLIDKFKMFYISGGMPASVVALLEKQDIEQVQQVLRNVLDAYSLDFSKHVETKDVPKINYLWESIPSQLARENKKFLYQAAKPGARARDYENSLLWLSHAGLAYRIFKSNKPGLPLAAYDDLSAFKIYLLDVGLLRRLSLLEPVALKEGNRLFTEFKGALSENFILQSLIQQFDAMPRYWTSGNQAEVDFLIQYQNHILPVEVKWDKNVQSKSLAVYEKTYKPFVRIRYSLNNLKMDGNLINIPLFMADYTKKILKALFI